MSRIAGLFEYPSTLQNKRLLKTMLACMVSAVPAPEPLEVLDEPYFGATGAASIFKNKHLAVVFEGTIFNAKDCPLATSDAERFALLCEQLGVMNALKQVNGDFAVAVLDYVNHSLWLSRDRFGLKPLYYVLKNKQLAFASRPAALFEIPGISRTPDRTFAAIFAGAHYRYFDNRPETSPFQDIAQVPAAHALEFKNGSKYLHRYWEAQEVAEFKEGDEELAERYRDLLMDAVRIRIANAPAPCFTLSGGMDSSSVLACAVKETQQKHHAFSAVYPDQEFDESHEIKSMLDSAVAQWHPVRVDSPNVFDIVTKMVEAHDEPVATATWLSHYLVCQDVKQSGFQTMFGGLGGDELNAGEYEYYFYFFADLKRAGMDDKLRKEVEFWKQYHDHPIYQKNYEVMEQSLPKMVDFNTPGRCLVYQPRMQRYAGVLQPDFFNLKNFEPVMEHPFSSYLKNRTWQDLTRETLPCCVRAEDRHVEAFGLSRVLPFTDHRLVEFMYRVPGALKIRDGVTKHLLRLAMKGVLAEETRTRVKKTGWNAPAHQWFSSSNRTALMDMIRSRVFRERGIYNPAAVEKIVAEHFDVVENQRIQENHMMFLWQLVNLELWFRRVIEAPAPVLVPHD